MTEVDTEINSAITQERRVSTETQKLKEQKYLPPLLKDVFYGKSVSFHECSNTIDISGTKLESLLINFDTEIEEQIQKWDKLVKLRSKLFNKAGIKEAEEIRTRHLDYEYLQRLYDFNGKIKSSKIIKGLQNMVHPFGKEGRTDLGPEKHFQKIRATIHNHPDGTTFSPPDIDPFFIEALLPEDKAEYKDKLPKVQMLIVSNRDGHFLTFPTRETLMPSSLEREIDGISGNARWLKINMRNSWESLKLKYSDRQLKPYKGGKVELGRSSIFPRETNDLGDELVALNEFLRLSDKYKLPLYFLKRGETKFQRVSDIEEYFPELLK